MSDDKIFSIIDFGKSKVRLGVFANHLPNSKYICEFKVDELIDKNRLKEIIIETENKIDSHLKNINIMIDNSDILSVDYSIKNKIDGVLLDENFFKSQILETKNIIENNYKSYLVSHLLVKDYVLDNNIRDNAPINLTGNSLIINLKFILIPKKITFEIREIFKSNHIMINNIFNSSYIKSSYYCNFYQNFETKVFIDIGFKKTSVLIYYKNKLQYINYIKIGSDHITRDISKVLNKTIKESENLKINLDEQSKGLNHQSDNLLVKVIHARVEEIIDLSFVDFKNFDFIKQTNSILVFTGEGSNVLIKNPIYLKQEYNVFNEMSIFDENRDKICTSAYNYSSSEKQYEAVILPKKPLKKGFFEKLFHMFPK